MYVVLSFSYCYSPVANSWDYAMTASISITVAMTINHYYYYFYDYDYYYKLLLQPLTATISF